MTTTTNFERLLCVQTNKTVFFLKRGKWPTYYRQNCEEETLHLFRRSCRQHLISHHPDPVHHLGSNREQGCKTRHHLILQDDDGDDANYSFRDGDDDGDDDDVCEDPHRDVVGMRPTWPAC